MNTPYYTKAESDAIEANLRRQYNYGSSEYRGFLTKAQTPTLDGWYWATEIGTYTNAGGLVTLANKINMIEKDGTTFRLNGIDAPSVTVVDGFESTSTTEAGSANNDRLLNEKAQSLAKDNLISTSVSSVDDELGFINPSGEIIVFEGYKHSKKFPITEGQGVIFSAYVTGGISIVAFYDINNSFISGYTIVTEVAKIEENTIIAPNDTAFYAFSYRPSLDFPSYFAVKNKNIIKEIDDLKLELISLEENLKVKTPFINPITDSVGIIQLGGNYVDLDNYRSTPFKRVQEGQKFDYDVYVTGGISVLTYYNETFGFIQNALNFDVGVITRVNGSITIPNGVSFVRICYRFQAQVEPFYSFNLILNSPNDLVERRLKGYEDYSDKLFDFLLPKQVYTTCNNVVASLKGRNRNSSASIFLDRLLKTTSSEPNLRFETGLLKATFTSPMDVTDSDEFNPAVQFNKGENIHISNESLKINIGNFNEKTFNITHKSTLNSFTKNAHPKVLLIGDSITYAEQATSEVDDFSSNFGFHLACKELFVKDKIDNGNADYNITFLGIFEKEKTINYKGNAVDIRICHDGRRGISLAQHLNGTVTDFWNGTNWSLQTYLNKYRTMNDSGVRLQEGQGTGSEINSGNLNRIDLCTPTHVVFMLGANDHGAISIGQYQDLAFRIKTEFPNIIVGFATSEFGGTFFPSQYPMIPKEMNFYNRLDALQGHLNQYKLQKMLQEYYDNDTHENLGIYTIPFYFATPPYSYAYRIADNLSNGLGVYSETKIMQPYGWGNHIHINGIGHQEWGYQLYSWLKYTIAKNL